MRHPRGFVAGVLAIGVIATTGSCQAGSGATSGTAATAAATQAPPSAASTSKASLPAASLAPDMTASELFEDTTPYDALGLEERSSETRDGALIRDVRFAGADGKLAAAYIVGPATGPRAAGILFLHWLGEEDSSREEFLDEAVALAAHGIESVLLQQTFPWSARPKGVDEDRVAIGVQVRTTERALTLLANDVGVGKIAVVGHDFGGMHGILTASADARVSALVSMAPTATWADWFVTYFHVVDAAGAPAYAAALADLDPVARLGELELPVLLQFGTSDFYVPSAVVRSLTDAAPDGTDVKSYDVGHRLDEAARAERDAWLLEQLGIAS